MGMGGGAEGRKRLNVKSDREAAARDTNFVRSDKCIREVL